MNRNVASPAATNAKTQEEHQGNCMKQHAQHAVVWLKFPLFPVMTVRFIAVNVSQK
jgi:hypothetical protein